MGKLRTKIITNRLPKDLKEKQKKKFQQHLTTSSCVLDEGLQRLDREADVDGADSLSVLKRDFADLTSCYNKQKQERKLSV